MKKLFSGIMAALLALSTNASVVNPISVPIASVQDLAIEQTSTKAFYRSLAEQNLSQKIEAPQTTAQHFDIVANINPGISYNPQTANWWIILENDKYHINLDFYSAEFVAELSSENNDLDLSYCYIKENKEGGVMKNFKAGTISFKAPDGVDGTIDIVANLTDEDDNTYTITAHRDALAAEPDQTITIKANGSIAEETILGMLPGLEIMAENEEYALYMVLYGGGDKEYKLMDVVALSITPKGEPEKMLQLEKAENLILADGMTRLTGTLLSGDNIEYVLDLTLQHASGVALPGDMQEGKRERYYTSSDLVEIKYNTIEGFDGGIVTFDLIKHDQTEVLSIWFFVDEEDPQYVLPASAYPINSTMTSGTVLASVGIEDGDVWPSFSGDLTVEGEELVVDNLAFMIAGVVNVEHREGTLFIKIDATNSYGLPIHIEYNAAATALDNTTSEHSVAQKILAPDGQIYILRAGHTYTTDGQLVK